MATYKETAEQVVAKIGGKENVSHAWHCVTRLRFNLEDKEKAEVDAIKKIPGVMGAQFSGDQFQVIIGNTVDDVFQEVEGIVGSGTGKGSTGDGEKESVASIIFDAISSIFTPIVPALAGTGLLKGFLALATIMGLMTVESQTYQLLFGLSDTVLYFFPMMLAVTAAEKFKTSKFLAMTLAGAMIYPTFLGPAIEAFNSTMSGQAAPAAWKLFGYLPVPLVKYTSAVIPIIFTVLILKYVNNWVRKWMPKVLNLMFTPMVSLLIVFPIAMVIIGPAGTYLGNFVGDGIAWLFQLAGPVAGLVLGATFPLLVITGMHYSLVPVALTNLAKNGYENMIGPINAVTNVAQSGAAFAVALRSKSSEMKQIALSSGISASIGITEPAMYGVNLKLKKPFYAALAAGGIAGAFVITMNARSFGGGGMPGFLSIPSYIHTDDRMNVIWFILGLVLSWVLAFVFTLIIGFKEEVAEESAELSETTEKVNSKAPADGEKFRVYSPINGELLPLSTVPDATFAQELVGKGIAIQAQDENIYAPLSGKIMMFPESKHAIGILGDNGVEVLMHIGIDTVELGGEGFNFDLKVGQQIEKGQLLGTVDYEFIRSKGLETMTMVIITNTMDYLDVSAAQNDGVIYKEEELIYVI